MFAPQAAPATRAAQAALDRTLLEALGLDEAAALRLGDEEASTSSPPLPPPPLDTRRHARYLRTGLRRLPSGFASLGAGRPWIVYWVAHGLALLGEPLNGQDADDAVSFLAACQHPDGGYGGGPGQLPHLAPTYAAVAALATLDAATSGRALASIDRAGLASFLASRAVPAAAGGGFSVCEGGEVDTRGAYTALAVSDLAGLDTAGLAARASVLAFLGACQTHEGGLAGAPGGEAHGGYTLCGLAAALLACGVRGGEGGAPPAAVAALRAALDLRRLGAWAAACQSPSAGGFAGRTAKLVDGCYSYWQGAAFPLVEVGGGLPPPPRACARRGGRGADGGRRSSPPPFDPDTAPPLPGPPPLPAGAASPPGPLSRATAALAAAEGAAARGGGAAPPTAAAVDEARAGAAMAAAGAAFLAALHPGVVVDGAGAAAAPLPLFNAPSLVAWVRALCQPPSPRGGLRDKPGAAPDFYHTCYCLSGLAAVDALLAGGGGGEGGGGGGGGGGATMPSPHHPPPQLPARADPLLNVTRAALARARARFG